MIARSDGAPFGTSDRGAVLSSPPPHDPDAELALLAARIADATTAHHWIARAGGVVASDYYTDAHRVIALALDAIEGRGATGDAVTLRLELARVPGTRTHGLDEALAAVLLRATSINPANAIDYATRVRTLARAREMRRGALEVQEAMLRGDDAGLEAAKSAIAAIETQFTTLEERATFRWVTSEEMLAEPEEDWSFLWHPIVARSALTLIAASPKCGKSWLLFAWLGALARGVEWLGRPPSGRQVRVLLISEEPRFVVRRRLAQFGVGNVDVLTLDRMPAGAGWPSIVEAAAARAAAVEAEAVIFDTISTLARILDENAAPDVNAALLPVLNAARAGAWAAVVVHHAGKDGNIRGSTAFDAVPDCLVEVRRVGGEGSRRRSLHVRGRLPDAPERPIVVEYVAPSGSQPATYRLDVTSAADPGMERERLRVKRIDDRILDFLRREAPGDGAATPRAHTSGWVRRTQIAELTGLKPHQLEERLPVLVEMGSAQVAVGTGRGGGYVYAAPGVAAPTVPEPPGNGVPGGSGTSHGRTRTSRRSRNLPTVREARSKSRAHGPVAPKIRDNAPNLPEPPGTSRK